LRKTRKTLGLNKKRIPLLIVAGVLMTLGLIVLMNLEEPKTIVKTKAASPESAVQPVPNAAPGISASPEPSATNKPPESNSGEANSAESKSAEAKSPEASAGATVNTQPLGEAANIPGLVTEADMAALKIRNLLIPVEGVTASQLRDSFFDGRSEGRQHQALDIMAAGGSPVVAAADGKVARLFQSDKGGITLYQLDSTGLYYYYYAHLQRYADGVVEGKEVKRGDVIAYVGDTGNAGAGNFHLHFAITKPAAPGKWSGGAPIKRNLERGLQAQTDSA
jgi:murein DD-endopeptidase MepM/ murein hydrolase activator NlpD